MVGVHGQLWKQIGYRERTGDSAPQIHLQKSSPERPGKGTKQSSEAVHNLSYIKLVWLFSLSAVSNLLLQLSTVRYHFELRLKLGNLDKGYFQKTVCAEVARLCGGMLSINPHQT